MKTATAQTANVIRFVGAALLALALGLALTQDASAQKNAKGFTQADSIGVATDICEAGGGSIEVSDSPFEGVKISECTGGDSDGRRCAHGQKTTNCSTPTSLETRGDIVVFQSFEVATDPVSSDRTFEVAPSDTATFESSPGTVTLQPLETRSTAP